MSSEEKTEDASHHKLQQARRRGEVAYSSDVVGTGAFVSVLLALWLAGDDMLARMRRLLGAALDAAQQANGPATLPSQVLGMLAELCWIVLPPLLAAMVGGLAAGWLQTRGIFSSDPLKPDFGRMNPANALKRIASSRQLLEVVKVALKVALLSTLLALVVRAHLQPLVHAMHGDSGGAAASQGRALWAMFGLAALAFIVLALLDYGHQAYEFLKNQRMGNSEKRQEHRNLEGDPNLKSALRSQRMEWLKAPPPRGIAGASVVVTNPTHFAVALHYEEGITELPVVVGKAEGAAALAMRHEAGRLSVPVFEAPPLARSLYRLVAEGDEILDEHLVAVAEVFRWLRAVPRSPGAADAAE